MYVSMSIYIHIFINICVHNKNEVDGKRQWPRTRGQRAPKNQQRHARTKRGTDSYFSEIFNSQHKLMLTEVRSKKEMWKVTAYYMGITSKVYKLMGVVRCINRERKVSLFVHGLRCPFSKWYVNAEMRNYVGLIKRCIRKADYILKKWQKRRKK